MLERLEDVIERLESMQYELGYEDLRQICEELSEIYWELVDCEDKNLTPDY